jgi:hypothetical protein
MSIETLISVEEYLSTSYDPDVEYVNGVLVERNVGDRLQAETEIHAAQSESRKTSLAAVLGT